MNRTSMRQDIANIKDYINYFMNKNDFKDNLHLTKAIESANELLKKIDELKVETNAK